MAFGNKQRENERLKQRIETLREERDDARKLAGIHHGNLVRMAQARTALHDEKTLLAKQLSDALKRLHDAQAEPTSWTALRGELATARRLLEATQKQLDDATKAGDQGHAWARKVAPKPGVKA